MRVLIVSTVFIEEQINIFNFLFNKAAKKIFKSSALMIILLYFYYNEKALCATFVSFLLRWRIVYRSANSSHAPQRMRNTQMPSAKWSPKLISAMLRICFIIRMSSLQTKFIAKNMHLYGTTHAADFGDAWSHGLRVFFVIIYVHLTYLKMWTSMLSWYNHTQI